jgi:HEAT repeat protein
MSPAASTGGEMQDLDVENFQKGNKGKLVAIAALVLALGGGAAFLLSGGGGPAATELTVEQAASAMKEIFVKPKPEQLAEWRKWAATPGDEGGMTEIKQEALKQLAWARDPEGVKLAADLLTSPAPKLQSMAATALAHYGSPAADSAKPALLAALKTAGPGSKPQIAWALVTLGEAAAFEEILTLYRAGHLATVQRLGGGTAFDPNKIVALAPLEKVAGLAGDSSASVRQLVATVLSRNAESRWTDTLIQLLGDSDSEVARQAAPGLGKIGDKKARDPLISKLKDADKESREKYLDAIKNGSGGPGLVLALYAFTNESDVQKKWYRRKEIMGLIDGLNDPRGADALFEYLQVEEDVHWRYRVARALAQVGDPRGIPELAKRLRMDPAKVYSDEYDWEMELKRDDQERVEAARMIADVVRLYPDKAEQFRTQAEDAIIFWMHEMPSPHANALRALAAMGSTKDIDALRKWSNPDVPLPKEGQQPPMPDEFVIAQSALRYIGMLKDEQSFKVLIDMLKKRPEKLHIDNEGMYQGGLAILGMSLNALGKGASDGLSEWGDPKGFEPLLKYATDPWENENGRMSACAALAWTASGPDDLKKVAEKIGEFSSQEPKDSFRRKCLLETLVQRPVPGTAPALLGLLNESSSMDTRPNLARAIAKSGIDADTEAKLFEIAKNENLMSAAALALILGGSPDAAARAVALYADKPKVAIDELQDLWSRSFGFWSTADLEEGVLFRYVDNAIAMSHVVINATPQEWATGQLEREFEKLTIDNGPHSFTRVMLRNLLYRTAQGSDAAKAQGAVSTLRFLKEQGVLMALRDIAGPVQKQAEEAVFEIVNPKVLQGVKPAEKP